MSINYDVSGWGSMTGSGEAEGLIIMIAIFGIIFVSFKIVEFWDSINSKDLRMNPK